ncbi:MAG: hypothetical protein HQ546_10825 [Planctomycetes bacterium]|nr:hypothetical protein [Planctomycetota bacterium]
MDTEPKVKTIRIDPDVSHSLVQLATNAMSSAGTLLGVNTGLAGIVSLLGQVHEWNLKLAKSQDAVNRAAGERLGRGTGIPADAQVGQLAYIMGVFRSEAYRKRQEASYAYGTPPADTGAAMERIWSDLPSISKAKKEAILGIALKAGRVGEIEGDIVGRLPGLFAKQYGAKTESAMAAMFAQMLGVSSDSAYTPGQFAEVLESLAPALSKSGLGYGEQLTWTSAFSQYAPYVPRPAQDALDSTDSSAYQHNAIPRKALRFLQNSFAGKSIKNRHPQGDWPAVTLPKNVPDTLIQHPGTTDWAWSPTDSAGTPANINYTNNPVTEDGAIASTIINYSPGIVYATVPLDRMNNPLTRFTHGSTPVG